MLRGNHRDIYRCFACEKYYVYIFKLLLVFTCIAASYLLIVGTMNHPNIDMDKIELLASKKCARMVCIIELLMIIVGMQIRNFEEISIMISLAIILCSVSMKLAQLVRQKI